jgi:hypothetical protein
LKSLEFATIIEIAIARTPILISRKLCLLTSLLPKPRPR